jgi:hypothetical protein
VNAKTVKGLNVADASHFVTLFRGRGDVYGHNEGRCVKEALTFDKFIDHLEGDEAIGVYPIVPKGDDFKVVWGCSDFDTAEAWTHAKLLHDSLQAAGVTAWVERSRSKGFHVWVFCTELVSATAMRNMFLAAHQVAQVPATEVNPKQTRLASGQYGNYVRLPYPNATDTDALAQRVVDPAVGPNAVIPFSVFVNAAFNSRVSPERVAELASLYVEPPKAASELNDYDFQDVNLMEAMRQLSPLGQVIWRDGPLEGQDRSRALTRLGHVCVTSGLNPSQTKAVVKTADQRWGKYHLRADGELQIDKLVIRVHS